MPTVPGSMIENPEKHRNRRLLLVAFFLKEQEGQGAPTGIN